MTKVPNLNYGQVINALRRDGWVIVRQKGSHIRLQKHTTERTLKLTVPAHNPIKRSTLSHIIKQAHLSIDEFTRLLQKSKRVFLKSQKFRNLLAYLAEQVIEMNKKKNEEIKGFLKWLEREIGAEINCLANQTAMKEYHETDFNQLLEVLKKNRNKISIDPSERKIQELLENQFTKSMSILEPLKTIIKFL